MSGLNSAWQAAIFVMMIPFTFRAVLGVAIALMLLPLFFYYRNSRPKTDYASATGNITLLDKKYGSAPTGMTDPEKLRYIRVDGYPYVFEIFVGKDPGDITPEFEQIDSLRVGDNVTVYYYETDDARTTGVNRFAKFIDKDGKSYFEEGARLTLTFVMTGLCAALILGSWILYKKGKMPY